MGAYIHRVLILYGCLLSRFYGIQTRGTLTCDCELGWSPVKFIRKCTHAASISAFHTDDTHVQYCHSFSHVVLGYPIARAQVCDIAGCPKYSQGKVPQESRDVPSIPRARFPKNPGMSQVFPGQDSPRIPGMSQGKGTPWFSKNPGMSQVFPGQGNP